MRNLLSILVIGAFTVSPVFAEGLYDSIQPANPLEVQTAPISTVVIPPKKATLTHNDIHNQYLIAFDRFMQSNVKSSYMDFKILIDTMVPNDYTYMRMAESMADIGFFNLSDLAANKIDDRNLSDFLVGDVKSFYFPSKKLKNDDEVYLGEVYSNIVYNDQSREATSELVKNVNLITNSDYANYVAALGYLKSNDILNAERYIDTAIKMNPQNLNYKKLKAEIQAQGKKPQNALKTVAYINPKNYIHPILQEKLIL